MNESKTNDSTLNSNLFIYFSITLIVSVAIAGIIGFYVGKGSSNSRIAAENQDSNQNLVSKSPDAPTPLPTAYTIAIKENDNSNLTKSNNDKACEKYGLAQKWEFLTSYIVKENDSIKGIAKNELGDETRVNEILNINGVSPLIVSSTIYLPPESVKKSNGNLKQINGKLVGKDISSWHITLTSDDDGQVAYIPAFLFKNIEDRDSYIAGECLTIFLDDGNEVYTVTRQ